MGTFQRLIEKAIGLRPNPQGAYGGPLTRRKRARRGKRTGISLAIRQGRCDGCATAESAVGVTADVLPPMSKEAGRISENRKSPPAGMPRTLNRFVPLAFSLSDGFENGPIYKTVSALVSALDIGAEAFLLFS